MTSGSIQNSPSQRGSRPRGASTINAPSAPAASCQGPISLRARRDLGVRADPFEGRPQQVERHGGGDEQHGPGGREDGAGEQPEEDHGDDEGADQGNGQRVDEGRHQRLLGEDTEGHRREPRRDRDLHRAQGP